MGLFQQASRKRITLSLNTEDPSDKAIFDFLSGLPRRTRSEIMKEILLDALERKDDRRELTSQTSHIGSSPEATDPEEIMENLF
jgi:hypothetical protein